MVLPFLKWAGGKRDSIPHLEGAFPDVVENYYEPFLGGGAIALHLMSRVKGTLHLNDSNPHLIKMWMRVRSDVDGFIEDLKKLGESTEENYFFVRARYNTSPCEVTLYFLTKLCFGGGFRMNKAGVMNAGYSKYTAGKKWIGEASLRSVSASLKDIDVNFYSMDWKEFLAQFTVSKGDFVFIDPPYAKVTGANSFQAYSKEGWSKDSTITLCDWMKLNSVVPMLMTNHKCVEIEFIGSSQFAVNVYKARRRWKRQTHNKTGHTEEEIFVTNAR